MWNNGKPLISQIEKIYKNSISSKYFVDKEKDLTHRKAYTMSEAL